MYCVLPVFLFVYCVKPVLVDEYLPVPYPLHQKDTGQNNVSNVCTNTKIRNSFRNTSEYIVLYYEYMQYMRNIPKQN